MEIEYITEREVVKLTGRALSTLRNDRATKRGFTYVKWGRFIRYRKSDVITFMEAHKVRTEVQVPGVSLHGEKAHDIAKSS